MENLQTLELWVARPFQSTKSGFRSRAAPPWAGRSQWGPKHLVLPQRGGWGAL